MEHFVNKLKNQEIQKQAEQKKLDTKADKFENLVWGKKAKKALREEQSSEEEVDSEEERILMEKL